MRYRLATYRECKAHREWNTTCPDCGRKGKFSPYIDTTTMQPVDDKCCGRCNRLSNCGYHLPPREIPRTEDYGSRESREIREICVRQKEDINETKKHQREAALYEKMHRACEQSQPWGSHLVTWLRTKFSREQVDAALKRYHVGGTPDGATLWWQIDEQGRVHTGKAMQYNPLTGHRVKEQGFPVNWAHRMRIYGEPSELVVPQCLFGLHLLNDNVDVNENLAPRCQHPLPHREGWGGSPCLVESEKTALIMSLVCPDRVWLATGGKANFKEQMLAPLIGMEVAVYPDADALHDWYARVVEMNRILGTRLYIPTWYYNLMDHPETHREGLDLADVVL